MSSVVRSVLGAALLLTGASAAMAQSANPTVAGQPVQGGASKPVAASNTAPVANQTVQTGASTTIAATNSAPVADKSQKTRRTGLADNSDPHGGFDPNSPAGTRAFWEGVNPY